MRVARWYCPDARESFSLLPDCLASRLRGSLDDVEAAVVTSEVTAVEKAAHAVRTDDIELPGAVRWLRRRRGGVHAALRALVTAMPGRLGPVAELRAVRCFLGADRALVALREIAADHLYALPLPLGLWRPPQTRPQTGMAVQHETGPDPPAQ